MENPADWRLGQQRSAVTVARQALPRGCCSVRGFILKSKDLIKLIYAHGYKVKSERASLVAQLVKNPPAIRETWVRSLGWEDPLEKEKATHSSIHCTIKLMMNNRNPQLHSLLSLCHFPLLPNLLVVSSGIYVHVYKSHACLIIS